jgi:hypothetical protein
MKPITFTSPLSQKDVYLTMKNLTNTNADKPLFVGTVTEDGFSVMKYRLFQGNKFFLRQALDPQLNAVVTEDNNGTKITINATLTKWNKIGSFVMGVLILGIIIFLIINAIATSSLELLAPAVAIVIFEALICLLFSFIFTLRAKRLLKILKKNLT